MSRTLSRQFLLFLLIGGAQVVVDWAMFVALTYAGLPLVAGNLAGRATGACLGYWLNGRYTFATNGRARLDAVHLRRFVVAWLLLTALSTLLLAVVGHRINLQAAWIAKPVVEAATALLGFVVWRQWVYR
ncbi:MAG: GtrA family protein [Arenimonas sp.]|nr:GtrA family protein [Arenimonas sp.]MBP8098317.1 GtrA family protein [Arenimonas sp.]